MTTQSKTERRYTARARAWGLGETNGKETIAVQFEILTPDAEANHMTWYGFFTEKAWERTIDALRYCGWEGNDLADLAGLDKNEVELVVDDEDYQGNMVAKIKWINRLGVALKAPLTGDNLKGFAARMRDQIKAKDAAEGRKPTQARTPPRNGGLLPQPPLSGQRPTMANRAEEFGPPPMDDNDIPF